MADVLRFEGLEVRPAERALFVDGTLASLGSRAFDLLLLLIAHRDRVMAKAELIAALWPGMVVEENSLHSQVSTLRKLIGPGAVATVQGRGYRFTLKPEGASTAPDSPAPPLAAQIEAPPPLPAPLLGREGDCNDILALLRTRQLVSLVGLGGIGKTQLALGVAHARREACGDAVCWVDLSGLRDTRLVPAVAARALGLAWTDDTPLSELHDAAAIRAALLVIDNAEHVLDAVATLLRGFLAARRKPQLLVTSRTPLRVEGEAVFRVDALALAPEASDAATAARYAAIALFVRQAQADDRHFALTAANVDRVVAVCRRIEGVPLALKLAAARLATLGLDELGGRLRDSLQLLRVGRHDVPERQRTMEAALDWSHDLLDDADRAVFRRLSIFAGSFTLAAALASGADADEWPLIDSLQRLADDSLLEVLRPPGAPTRYRLHECTRQYAARQFARLDDDAGRGLLHARAMARVMDEAYEEFWRLGDEAWLQRHEPELDDVRLALDTAAAIDRALARRLAGSACPLFLLLGLAPEARRRCAELAPADDEGTASAGDSRYWLERSRLDWGVSGRAMLSNARRALAGARAHGDARGVYLALRCLAAAAPLLEAVEALELLAGMAAFEHPGAGARLRAQGLLARAAVLQALGDIDAAADALQSLLALADGEALAASSAAAWTGLAFLALQAGDPDAALHWAASLLARRASERGNFVLLALAASGAAHLQARRVEPARDALLDFARASRLCNWEWLALHADLLAWLAAATGRSGAAARILGYANAAREHLGPRDAIAAAAHQRTMVLCASELAGPQLASELAAGAALDAHGACAQAFGPGWAAAAVSP